MTDAGGPAFLRMPLHLLALVLSQLDSIPTLASAILAHSSFYAAFDEDRDRIARAVLANQIPPEILDYAVPTYLASSGKIDRSDLRSINKFLTRQFSGILPARLRWPCELAAERGPVDMNLFSALSRTHCIVEHFTRDFLQDTLPLLPNHLGLRRQACSAASPDEVFRIQRAIYRFQLYCNLFRFPYTRQQIAHDLESLLTVCFFGPFSPWVNEQLACVHDYFERILSRTFDEVAAHDVQWGNASVNWLSKGSRNEHKQGYLFHGIEFLFRLHQAKTYGERRDILLTKGAVPPRSRHMLAAVFSRCSKTSSPEDWHRFWSHIDDTSEFAPRCHIHFVDLEWQETNGPDMYGSGPFRMWREAHKDVWEQDIVYHDRHDWLRRCGYVLWDAPESSVSDEELRQHIVRARELSLLDHFRRNDGSRKAAMKRTWKQRAAVYAWGGRGYWSEGDLSGITWTGPITTMSLPVGQKQSGKEEDGSGRKVGQDRPRNQRHRSVQFAGGERLPALILA